MPPSNTSGSTDPPLGGDTALAGIGAAIRLCAGSAGEGSVTFLPTVELSLNAWELLRLIQLVPLASCYTLTSVRFLRHKLPAAFRSSLSCILPTHPSAGTTQTLRQDSFLEATPACQYPSAYPLLLHSPSSSLVRLVPPPHKRKGPGPPSISRLGLGGLRLFPVERHRRPR